MLSWFSEKFCLATVIMEVLKLRQCPILIYIFFWSPTLHHLHIQSWICYHQLWISITISYCLWSRVMCLPHSLLHHACTCMMQFWHIYSQTGDMPCCFLLTGKYWDVLLGRSMNSSITRARRCQLYTWQKRNECFRLYRGERCVTLSGIKQTSMFLT
jgi:hypothetical protein